MLRKILIIIITFTFILSAAAQQRTMFSQYMLNKYSINPAVAGSTPYSPICLSYKQLWTGIDEAPSFQLLNSHFAINDKMGIGGQIFNYSTGPTKKMGVEGTYAYHFNINEVSKISLGLSALLYQYSFNKNNLILEDYNDNAIIYSSEKLIVPDATFGTYYYSENFYAGLSVHNLFNRKVDLMNDDILEQRQVRHYFVHGGYIIESGEFKVEPSFLLRFIEAGVFQADINLKGTYKDMVSLGLSYRHGDAIAVMLGIGNDKITFGYAYDITLTNIKNVSNGSHELMLIYKLSGSKGNGIFNFSTEIPLHNYPK